MIKIEKILIGGINIFSNPICRKYDFFCGFTTRTGGFSKKPFNTLNLAYHVGDDFDLVSKNRQLIINEVLGQGPEYLYSASQVHSSRVLLVDNHTRHREGNIPIEADSIITGTKHMPLMVLGADCNLIIMIDIRHRAAGVVHAGWKGTLNGILIKTLREFQIGFNSSPEDILVFFGPSIRHCCYRVDKALIETFLKRFGEGDYYINRDGHFFLDLVNLNLIHLKDFGIQKDSIFDTGQCTNCNKEFFSYRQEKNTGRQGAIVMID